MANSFLNIKALGTEEGSTLATVPTGVTWVIIGFTVSNKAGYQVEVDIDIAEDTYGKSIPIPAGRSYLSSMVKSF